MGIEQKKREFLSPSCINSFYSNVEDWYKSYIMNVPRMKQTPAMGLGSAFDAFVKWEICQAVSDVIFPYKSFDECYDDQVAPHLNLKETAEKVFCGYVDAGMLKRVLRNKHGKLIQATMEVLITAKVGHNDIIVGGYPDFLGLYEDGTKIILDWKVNGYYSGRRVSTGKMPTYITGDLTGREHVERETDFSRTGWGVQLDIYSLCTNINTGMIHQFAFNGINNCRYAEFYGSLADKSGTLAKIREVSRQLKNVTALSHSEIEFIKLCF